MGYKVHKSTPPMQRELDFLLYDLCVKYGFCIPPTCSIKIIKSNTLKAEEFAKMVVEAEGMCVGINNHYVKKFKKIFIQRFGTEIINKSTFVD